MFVNFQINIGHNQFKTAIKNTEVYTSKCALFIMIQRAIHHSGAANKPL